MWKTKCPVIFNTVRWSDLSSPTKIVIKKNQYIYFPIQTQ